MGLYRVGIDGGGTRCRAAVADADGRLLGRGISGAANILTDPETALVHIRQATEAAFKEAGLPLSDISSAYAVLGLAGNNVADAVSFIAARLPFAKADIVSDVVIALQGALGDRDGAVASLGTGTVYCMRQAGTISMLGGHGFKVGDLGSGARLGQGLLQEVLLAHDGIQPSSPLTEAVLAEFGHSPEAIIAFAHGARPADYGRYAPSIFSAAAAHDPVAIDLIRAAAYRIDQTLDAIIARGVTTLCLVGGLAPLYRPWLAERGDNVFAEPLADALTGAVALAVQGVFTATCSNQAEAVQ
ncbi:N-acetylglucosamine kinase [Rhizobium sp. Leaf384]|uniref:BadF/BadG/BcrA/BcrD ATPase family protein n=1 Tax=unclassified Rhizobium TaxID=2613769 RepID=UPI000715F154|nr:MULTISPECIES: BadF/BadG/BcrA/BcrD ATPase family protein [unclassified Rhizobium]KQS81404.1 N-acetylglucosamine kinase [Rhizobium sp. Leaf384]KQS87314.1 N-acetylglucosamine kinase [Rhizobium sp. Leaf383]